MRRPTKTGNTNARGSAAQRRELKAWMLQQFGDGTTAPCAFCGQPLTADTMTKDRHPIPARAGGRYTRDNVRPACLSCNASHGARQAAAERKATAA